MNLEKFLHNKGNVIGLLCIGALLLARYQTYALTSNLSASSIDNVSTDQQISSNQIGQKSSSQIEKLNRQEIIIERLKRCEGNDYRTDMKRRNLENLTQSNFTLTEDNLSDLENNLESAILKINLLEFNNLNAALKSILNSQLSSIKDNAQKAYAEKLIALVDEETEDSGVKNQNLLPILEQLSLMSKHLQNSLDDTYDKNFYGFIKSIKDAYKVCISRNAADEILLDNKDKVQEIMESMSKDKNLSVPISYNLCGIKIGAALSFSKYEGADVKQSLYRIDRGGNVKIFFGASIDKILKAEVGGNIGAVSSVIFYSLEQYLDSGEKFRVVNVNSKDNIKRIVSSRKEMQESEKLLLAEFNQSIEIYLKAMKVIPDGVVIDWPDITKCNSQYYVSSTKYGVNIAAALLSEIGLKVSGIKQNITALKPTGYLSLLLDDCLPSDNLTADDIQKFFALKNGDEDGVCKHKIFLTAQELTEKKQDLLATASLILGDLKQYNYILTSISQNGKNTDKKDIQLKHEIQNKWLSDDRHYKKNRKNMLEASIIVSSYLREFASNSSELNIFKQIYQEICHLSNMQVFSKNKHNRNSTFNFERKFKSSSLEGELTIGSIPLVEKTSAAVTYREIEGNAFEASEDMVIQIRLPMTDNLIVGRDEIKSEIVRLGNKLLQKKDSNLSRNLGNAFILISDKFSEALSKFKVKWLNTVSAVLPINNYSIISIFLCKANNHIERPEPQPLPGEDIIYADKDLWVLKLVKLYEPARKTNYIFDKTKISVSELGAETLSYLINRYNIFKMGIKSSNPKEEGNPLWERFKKANYEGIGEILYNINEKNSNSKYELQCIYSDIISHQNYNSEDKQLLDKIFRNFLTLCKEYHINKKSDILTAAIKALDIILDLYYTEYFIPEYNKVFSIN